MQGGNRKGKAAVGPGQFDDYDLAALWAAGEDVRSLKSLILFGLKGMAAYAYHARALGRTDPAVNAFFYEALEAIGAEKTPDELLALVLNVLSAMGTVTMGNALFGVLIVVSSPMVCSGYWALSLFLWACLLIVSHSLLRKNFN